MCTMDGLALPVCGAIHTNFVTETKLIQRASAIDKANGTIRVCCPSIARPGMYGTVAMRVARVATKIRHGVANDPSGA